MKKFLVLLAFLGCNGEDPREPRATNEQVQKQVQKETTVESPCFDEVFDLGVGGPEHARCSHPLAHATVNLKGYVVCNCARQDAGTKLYYLSPI